MKKIFNWDKATVFDLESDGLLDEATKLHIMGWKLHGKEISTFHGVDQFDRIIAMFKWHIANNIPVVCHNAITYDIPLLEKLSGEDLSDLMVIDTLALSWYLNIDRARHGLDHFLDDYGVKKPEIDDWENLSYEEYKHRVKEDVKINHLLWEDLKSRLIDMYSRSKAEIDLGNVGGKRMSPTEKIYIDSLKGLSVEEHINRILTFLMFKMDCVALQEKTKWQVDVPHLEKGITEFEGLVEEAATALESVMPKVAKYAKRTPPKNPFKKNGELSVSGQAWEDRKAKLGKEDEWGNTLAEVREVGSIHELVKYESPNINSHDQVKDFLFSKGWKPQTFEFKKDEEAFTEWINNKPIQGARQSSWKSWMDSKPKERAIPQVRKDGELCPSVEMLAQEVPEVKYLEEYSVIKHRLDLMKGILDRTDGEGKVIAGVNGFTNTLRMKHRAPIVNLPAAKAKHSQYVRSSLISPDGFITVNSDLSSLEDRVKIMFMYPHDPKYAEEMSKDTFDPHIATAVAMGLMTEEEGRGYVAKSLPEKDMARLAQFREMAKPVNYLSVYSGTYRALMRQTGWEEQRCKDAIDSYWELNWAVKAIADEQVVIEDAKGLNWLINPINGFLYNIRAEKDKFSTLAQGTGAFFFDMWLDKILQKQEKDFGRKTLTAQSHDECTFVLRDTPRFRDWIEKTIRDSIKEVSEEYLVRRELDCDVNFGREYSSVH